MSSKLLRRKDFSAPADAARNLSKVTPPTLQRVHRNTRLFGMLDHASSRPVTWIHGPPGAGKTTLVASYLADKGIDPLWYRLDEGDADPATLFFYLAAALCARGSTETLPLLTQDHRAGLSLFARRFFRDLFGCPTTPVVVFDDYHEVAAGSPFHHCIANGLGEVPSGHGVIVVSRTLPPPQLARLRINGAIQVIEPETLRMTVDEAEGLARERETGASPARIASLARQTQGWTAGLILMLEAGVETVETPADAEPVPELLFDYFADEILDRMEQEERRILCILALMPDMTAVAAERLTGSCRAATILEDLRKRNYFTTRDVAAVPRYRFHPLFRSVLLERACELMGAGELTALRVKAAAVLEEDGWADAAVGLLVEADALVPLADLVRRRAPTLLREGRNDTLAAWLAKLPAEAIASDAWLSHWSGAVCVHTRPSVALPFFAAAFALFEAAGDVPGQFIAWAGEAEAVRVDAFGDMGRFNALIDRMHALIARYPDVPAGDVMLRVAMGMATGLARCRADREEVALWQERARQAARASGAPGMVELVAYMFAITDIQDANYAQADAALRAFPDPLILDRFPVARGSGLLAEAMLMLYRQRPGDLEAFVEEALTRLEEGGHVLWMPLLAGFVANDAVRRGDLALCDRWLGRVAVYADRISANRGVHYFISAGQRDILAGDLVGAKRHAEIALSISLKIGWPTFESFARLVRAEALLEAGALDEAAAELTRLEAVLARCAHRMMTSSALLLKADLAVAQDKPADGDRHIAEALDIAHRQGDRRLLLARSRATRVLAWALASDIKPEAAIALIKAGEYEAPDPDEEAWPWPVKVYTFGALRVFCNGEPLTFGRKTPKRLIMLLKAIVAFGGKDVTEDKLIDTIWPDEDGDAGHSALGIAIHRLRKLLGDPTAIWVKGGRLGLDPARCWLDVWSFERRIERRAAYETEEGFKLRVAAGVALYRGDFLGEDDEWWMSRRREQLRERLSRVAARP